jgi:MFS family permease
VPAPLPPSRDVRALPHFWPANRFYYGWAIVIASFAASLGEVPVFAPVLGVFIKPLEEDLGWSRTTIALGFSIGSIAGSLASVIVGRFVDRYGSRVVVAFAGLSITGALVGMSMMSEPWQFWALFGVGRGSAIAGIEIGTSVAVSKWFFRKRGRTLAMKGIGQRSGQALMPLIIFAIMEASDWRMAFVAMAGMAATFIVVPAVLLLRRQPEDFGLLPDGAHATSREDDTPGPAREAPRAVDEISWTLADARRTRAFWLIVAFTVGTPFVQGATNLHVVINFQDRGLSDGLAVSVLAIFAAVAAVTALPMGLLLERIHVRYGAILLAVVLIAALGVISFADSYPEALLFALLYGIAQGMRTIIETLLFANYFGRGHLGSIKGFTAPFRVIGPVGPILAGAVSDSTGSYTPVFIFFMGIALLMLVAIVFAKPPRKPVSPNTLASDAATP